MDPVVIGVGLTALYLLFENYKYNKKLSSNKSNLSKVRIEPQNKTIIPKVLSRPVSKTSPYVPPAKKTLTSTIVPKLLSRSVSKTSPYVPHAKETFSGPMSETSSYVPSAKEPFSETSYIVPDVNKSMKPLITSPYVPPAKETLSGTIVPKVLSGPMSETSPYVQSAKETFSETSDIVPDVNKSMKPLITSPYVPPAKETLSETIVPKVLSGPMSETSPYIQSAKETFSETSDIVPNVDKNMTLSTTSPYILSAKETLSETIVPKVLSGPMSETSPYVPPAKETFSETSDIIPLMRDDYKPSTKQLGGRYYKKKTYTFDMAF